MSKLKSISNCYILYLKLNGHFYTKNLTYFNFLVYKSTITKLTLVYHLCNKMADHSPTNEIGFSVYSNLAGAICDSKFIDSKVINENVVEGEFDYINCRYLDALARIVSVSGKCAAVFVRKCRSPEEQEAILTSQMESIFKDFKSKIDIYGTRGSGHIEKWKVALDENGQPKDTLKTLVELKKEIKASLKDNEDYVLEKLENGRLKWENIQTLLSTNLYIAYNSTVNDKRTKNVIKNILEGINLSISTSDHKNLVKIAFLTNNKFNSLLSKHLKAQENSPSYFEITTEDYKDLERLTKEIRSCYAMFQKDNYPDDAIKKIPYESIEKLLTSKWIEEEPFIRLRNLSLRIFQDATKLYALSQDKEKWVSLKNYKIVDNEANIHAEIALVMKIWEYEGELSDVSKDSLKDILPYIGISKLCCPLCHRTLDLLGVKHLGTHNVLYAGEKVWKPCEITQVDHKKELIKLEKELIKIIKDHLIGQIPELNSNLENSKVITFDHKLDPDISDDDEIESKILIDNGQTWKQIKHE